MPVPPLTLRLVKGAPLTAQEGDNNFAALRDFDNALESRLDIATNPDGTLKDPDVVGGSTATGSDDYVTTLTGWSPTVESDLIGKIILLLPTDFGNTSIPTLRILPLATPRAITLPGGVNMDIGDMAVNHIAVLMWDSTNSRFELLNRLRTPRANYYLDTGTANHVIVATSPAAPFSEAIALYAGYTVKVLIGGGNTNTAAADLKVGNLAATAIKKTGALDVQAGDLVTGRIYEFTYDGSFFQVTAGAGTTSGLVSADTTLSDAAVKIAPTSHNLGTTPVVELMLVNIADTATAGYAVGDVLPGSSFQWGHDGGGASIMDSPPIMAWANATQYGLTCGTFPAKCYYSHKTTGAAITASAAQFKADWKARVILRT